MSVSAQEASSSQREEESVDTDESVGKKNKFLWMVKPCHIYKEEYSECKSIRARFHQYFVDGQMGDCSHWKKSYDNCSKWEDYDDQEALKEVIENEKTRIRDRLKGHYGNDVWESRKEPPADWNSELPQDIQEHYESSFLKTKSDDLREGRDSLGDVEKHIREDSNILFDSESSTAPMCTIL